jgi:predicted transcriptional regulator
MMKHVQNMMPNVMGAQRPTGGPANLPKDMTRSQYLILTKYQQGFGKPKNVAKSLSMDKKHVEKETDVLRTNGYLTGKNKLTSKGLEALS